MKVAELMMLRRDVPRSVHHCLWMVDLNMQRAGRRLRHARRGRPAGRRAARPAALCAHRPGVRHGPATIPGRRARRHRHAVRGNRPPVPAGLSEHACAFPSTTLTRFEFDQPSGHSIHDVRLTPKPAERPAHRVVAHRRAGQALGMARRPRQPGHDLLGGAAARPCRDRGARRLRIQRRRPVAALCRDADAARAVLAAQHRPGPPRCELRSADRGPRRKRRRPDAARRRCCTRS